MKFSQFEDTKKLEQEINECINYLNEFLWFDTQEKHYFILSKLNLIICSGIDVYLFLDVTKEYRSNKKFLTKAAALIYIFIIATILKLGLGRIFLKDILLKSSDFYPVIIGGNNRLRFVDSSNSNALLIAKNSSSVLFTKNAMRAYCMNGFSDLNIIPDIIPINHKIYLERQINGLAINRIFLNDVQKKSVHDGLNSLFIKQEHLRRNVSISALLRYKKYILHKFLSRAKIDGVSKLFTLFKSASDKVEKHFGALQVSVCPSHGDLNRGNVFLDKDRISIIDWEYFLYRYAKYDYILYTYDLRHQPLSAYKNFIKDKQHLDFNVILFLIEELFFRILNFKEDIADSKVYVDTVVELLYESLLVDQEK